MQFESFLLIAQPEVSVLGESSATFVVPQVDPHDPLLVLVLGQRENLVQTEPVVLLGNKSGTKKGFTLVNVERYVAYTVKFSFTSCKPLTL